MTELKEKLLSLGMFEDDKYLDFYCRLIKDNITTAKSRYKTQIHHSIPCLYYLNRAEADKDSDNIKVNLLYRDHVLAHYYLCLAAKTNTIYYFKLLCAFTYMCNQRQTTRRNQYTIFNLDLTCSDEWLNEAEYLHTEFMTRLALANSEYNKGKSLSVEHRAKIALANTGKHITEDKKRRLREINLGKKHTEETKQKISSTHIGQGKGNKWMKKAEQTKSVCQKDFEMYLASGWVFGKATPDSRRIKIRCVETDKVFNSCQEADRAYHCCTSRAIVANSLAGGHHWERVQGQANQ